ncbi:hypothetical protein [Thermonema rossianum]|uniref:hypothetical protein n=1 Tax=Thermonema rossianum TaxID=55505 RepID=UPI00056F89B2|nr:hypothetical protein [Thermonema rossianum]
MDMDKKWDNYIQALTRLQQERERPTEEDMREIARRLGFTDDDLQYLEQRYQELLEQGKQALLHQQFEEGYDTLQQAHALRPFEAEPVVLLTELCARAYLSTRQDLWKQRGEEYAQEALQIAPHNTRVMAALDALRALPSRKQVKWRKLLLFGGIAAGLLIIFTFMARRWASESTPGAVVTTTTLQSRQNNTPSAIENAGWLIDNVQEKNSFRLRIMPSVWIVESPQGILEGKHKSDTKDKFYDEDGKLQYEVRLYPDEPNKWKLRDAGSRTLWKIKEYGSRLKIYRGEEEEASFEIKQQQQNAAVLLEKDKPAAYINYLGGVLEVKTVQGVLLYRCKKENISPGELLGFGLLALPGTEESAKQALLAEYLHRLQP